MKEAEKSKRHEFQVFFNSLLKRPLVEWSREELVQRFKTHFTGYHAGFDFHVERYAKEWCLSTIESYTQLMATPNLRKPFGTTGIQSSEELGGRPR